MAVVLNCSQPLVKQSIDTNALVSNPCSSPKWVQGDIFFPLSLSYRQIVIFDRNRSAKGPVPNLLISLFQFALFFLKDWRLQFSMPIITQGDEKIQQFCQDVLLKICQFCQDVFNCLFAKSLIITIFT